MNLDKNQLKKSITDSKSGDILVTHVSNLDKNSLKKSIKEIESFINGNYDYTITVIKR